MNLDNIDEWDEFEFLAADGGLVGDLIKAVRSLPRTAETEKIHLILETIDKVNAVYLEKIMTAEFHKKERPTMEDIPFELER